MDARGWVPATAGNLSLRLPSGRIAITRSGVHKGTLNGFDVIEVDLQGRPADPSAKPSAETILHCQIYAAFPDIGAVLHGHSVPATVLSMAEGRPGIRLQGYEVLKAFEGIATHEAALDLPLFPNDQDMRHLAAAIAPRLPDARATLIRGHGVYVWAPDMDTAFARLEALEFLLACELERRRL